EVISPLLSKFKTINGRDFFDIEDLNYILPSDKLEAERTKLAHVLNKHVWKCNFRSPIEEKLKNGGMMWSAFTESQWSELIKDIVRVLKYDGWIESLEATAQLHNCGKITKWIEEASCKACMKEKGVNIRIGALLTKMFESNEELKNIQCVKVEYPIGEWFGYFGKYSMCNIRRIFQSFVFLPEYMGVTYDEYIGLLNTFVKEANENKTYTHLQRCFAKKTWI
ncbi:27801_t:CDS:2, partial [Racocetra persica]